MKLNKTVYIEGGGTKLCEYDTDQLELSALWISIFTLSIILNLFAIMSNLAVVTACFLQKKRPPLIIYIHALAISDLVYALLAPLYTYRYVLQHWPNLAINFALTGRLSHHITVIGNTFSTISNWIVVALTIDRLILTRFPFKTSSLSTPRRAYFSISLIILSCFAFNTVCMYEFFEAPVIVDECSGHWSIPKSVVREDSSTYTPIRYRKPYQLYVVISLVLVLYALPTMILMVCNGMILRSFHNRQRSIGFIHENSKIWRRKATEKRLTKMIIVVSLIYVVCNIPDIATRPLWKFVSPLTVSNIQPIAHLFVMIDVSVNFVVYALYNRYLFDSLLTMCKCCGLCNRHQQRKGKLITVESTSSTQKTTRIRTQAFDM